MVYSWRFYKCPNCKKNYAVRIEEVLFFIRTRPGLGPKRLKCAACGCEFNSGLLEWQDRTTAQKIYYGFLSILYGLFVGLCLTPLAGLVFTRVIQNSEPRSAAEMFSGPYWLVFIILVLLLQLFRVALSIRRSEAAQKEPERVSFWTWQANLHGYAIGAGLVSIGVYMLLGRLWLR